MDNRIISIKIWNWLIWKTRDPYEYGVLYLKDRVKFKVYKLFWYTGD